MINIQMAYIAQLTSQIKSHVRTFIPYKTMQTWKFRGGEGFEFSLRSREDQTCVASVVGDKVLKSQSKQIILRCTWIKQINPNS